MKFYITMHRSHVSSKQSTAILSKLWNHKFREKEHYCLKKKNYCLQKKYVQNDVIEIMQRLCI